LIGVYNEAQPQRAGFCWCGLGLFEANQAGFVLKRRCACRLTLVRVGNPLCAIVDVLEDRVTSEFVKADYCSSESEVRNGLANEKVCHMCLLEENGLGFSGLEADVCFLRFASTYITLRSG